MLSQSGMGIPRLLRRTGASGAATRQSYRRRTHGINLRSTHAAFGIAKAQGSWAIVCSPEVLRDVRFVGEFCPSLIEMVKGLKARWISRRHSERSPHPHQPSGREMNLLTFAELDPDHLICNPVCRVQDISSLREQNKISNQVAYAGRSVAFHHVSECLDRSLGGKTAVPQSKPVEQLVLTRRLPDG